jgi:hypothetical protein
MFRLHVADPTEYVLYGTLRLQKQTQVNNAMAGVHSVNACAHAVLVSDRRAHQNEKRLAGRSECAVHTPVKRGLRCKAA